MTYRNDSYFAQGPPPSLIDGLLASGLIKEVPKKNLENESKTKSVKNVQEVVDRLAPIPVAKDKVPKPSIKKPVASKPKPVQSYSSFEKSALFKNASNDSLISLKENAGKLTNTHVCLTNAKKLSGSMLEQFLKIQNNFGISEIKDPSKYNQSISYELAELYYLINDFALELKEYNKDYAQVIIIIKGVMQNILQVLPELSKSYEVVIQRLKEEITELEKRIGEMNTLNNSVSKKASDSDNQVKILQTELRIASDKLYNEENLKKDALISIEEMQHINDLSNIKIKKLLETKDELEHKCVSMNKTIEDQAKNIDELNLLLAKYESEGAGFYPMYQKAANDYAQATITIENLEQQIIELSKKPTYADTETQCCSDKDKSTSKKMAALRKRAMSTDDNTSSQALLELDAVDSILASEDNDSRISLVKMESRNRFRRIATQMSGGIDAIENSSKINLHPHTIPKFAPSKPDKMETIMETIIPSNSNLNKQMPKVTFATQEEIKVIDEKPKTDEKPKVVEKPKIEAKPKIEEKPKIDEKPKIEEEAKVLEHDVDMVISEKNDATIQFIYQLLYTKPADTRDTNFDEGRSMIKRDQKSNKSFSWALNYILTILQNGFQYCTLEDSDKSFSEIISNVLSDSGKNTAVLDRLVSSLMEALYHYQETSKTVQFFMKFVSHKFSISDFLFFNMLLTNCANNIYPPVQTVMEDLEIVDDKELFTIHESLLDKYVTRMIKTGTFPADVKKRLISEAPIKGHPELVSFWDFAEEMIYIFNDFHRKFHKAIADIFLLIGSQAGARIGFGEYTDFMRVVTPSMTDKQVANSWKALLNSTGRQSKEVVSLQQLMKYICETTSMVEDIIALPVLDNFEEVITGIMDSISPLFVFLRTRYVKFIPKLIQSLDGPLRLKILEFAVKLRNSLLKCDLSTGFTMYRHILQYVDLKVIENSPYIRITSEINNDQMNSMINIFAMREKIAADSVSFTMPFEAA